MHNIRMLWEMCMNWLQNTARSSSITTMIWELHFLLTCMLHSKLASGNGYSLIFLAVIWCVLMQPICETESHPCSLCALALASIHTSLQTPFTQDMYGAKQSLVQKWRVPRVSCYHLVGLAETDSWDQVPSSPDAWFGRGKQCQASAHHCWHL